MMFHMIPSDSTTVNARSNRPIDAVLLRASMEANRSMIFATAAITRDMIVSNTGTGPPPSRALLARKAHIMLPAKNKHVRSAAFGTLRPTMSPDGAKNAIINPTNDTICITTTAPISGLGIPTQNLELR
jgi:hypothetical protein